MTTTLTKIAPSAQIAETAIIGENVEIRENTVISDHVIIRDNVKIGSNCKFHPYSVIGEDPQDFSYAGEESFVEIGDRNTFREFTTVHRAVGEGEKTIIGNDNYLMAYSHVGHNGELGNNITLSNNAQLAGHVVIEDGAVIGGTAAIHQHCRVGRLVMFSGMAATSKDVPPFFTYMRTPAFAVGINRFGMKKAGLSQEVINEIFKAFKIIYQSGLTLPSIISKLEGLERFDEIKELTEFLRNSKRGIKLTGG